MITNTGISVFNRTHDGIYKKHFIKYAFWEDTKSVTENTGYEKNDSVAIYIPKYKNDLSMYVSSKKFDGLNNKWTLENGSFIVKGTTSESQVEKIKELMEKYDDVFTILSVSDRDFGSKNMRHFEIRGK